MTAALKLMHPSFISGVQAGAGIAPRLVTECGQDVQGASGSGSQYWGAPSDPRGTQGEHMERDEH